MKNLLFGTVVKNNWKFDLGVLILRLSFGLSMTLAHGMGKMPPPDRLIEGVGAMGFPLPVVFAWAAALSELVGGFCLALGLFTRPAAIFLGITMAVAFGVAHAADPFQTKELAFLFLNAYVALAIMGGGRWAADRFFRSGN